MNAATWYATKSAAPAGSGAASRRLAVAVCGIAAFATGADVRKQHVMNPTTGRPTGPGGSSTG